METYDPDILAQTANLNTENCWGVLKAIIDSIMKESDGCFHIVKEPNKQEVFIYKEPNDEESSDEDDEDEDDDEGESEDGDDEGDDEDADDEDGSDSGSDEESDS